MSKRLHPIRRMHKAIAYEFLPSKQEAVIARHVKPLLDALELAHGYPFPHGKIADCPVCRLLAEWRAKL